MARKKDDNDELHSLQKENRDLKSTIKSLRKKLKRLVQLEQIEEEKKADEVEEEIAEDDKLNEVDLLKINKCPNCGGDLAFVSVAGRKFTKCIKYPHCRYRTEAVKE